MAVALGRALLLVILTGASYSYPVKQGFPSSYGANPASAGSKWDVPSSGGFSPAASGSMAVFKSVLKPASPETTQHKPSYTQPVQGGSAAPSYSSNSFAAPVHSGYSISYSSGPRSFQPVSTQDIAWAVAPPSLSRGEETPTLLFASSNPAPELLGPSYVSPPGRFLPAFQAGELSQMENIYEHGNSESETEAQGLQLPPGVQVVTGQYSASELQPSGLGTNWFGYPYDYMFLTGQYPPGTVSHFSSSFEQGRDHWQDAHYIRDYFPANPSTRQVKTFPAAFVAPRSIKQPSQSVKQSAGSTSYGRSGAATGQNQPYGKGSNLQPGFFEQPRQGSPTGGSS